MSLRLCTLAALLGAAVGCGKPHSPPAETLPDAGLQGDALTESTACTIRDVVSAQHHSCALATGGAVFCWGSNELGELGKATTSPGLPVQVSLPKPASQLSVGRQRSCARLANGTAFCWGRTPDSVDAAPVSQPPTLLALPGNVADVGAGGAHVCALTIFGQILCAGQASSVGDGTGKAQAVPVLLGDASTAHSVRTLSTGLYHTCALTRVGAILCWGRQPDDLGPPDGNFPLIPTVEERIGAGVVQIAAGHARTCVVHGDKTVSCLPGLDIATVGAFGRDNSAIGPGEAHTCVLKTGGTVSCAGDNGLGQLGNGLQTTPPAGSVFTVALPAKATRLSVGSAHACAVLTDLSVWCWGRGTEGQLGQGMLQSSATPVRVALPEKCTASAATPTRP